MNLPNAIRNRKEFHVSYFRSLVPTAIYAKALRRRLMLFLLHVALPIVLGGVIYIAFRDRGILLFDCLTSLGLSNAASPAQIPILDPLFCSLPDGLWVYAYGSWMRLIWKKKTWWCKLPLTLALGSEVGQYVHWVPGSFDLLDVFFYVFANYLLNRWNYE